MCPTHIIQSGSTVQVLSISCLMSYYQSYLYKLSLRKDHTLTIARNHHLIEPFSTAWRWGWRGRRETGEKILGLTRARTFGHQCTIELVRIILSTIATQ